MKNAWNIAAFASRVLAAALFCTGCRGALGCSDPATNGRDPPKTGTRPRVIDTHVHVSPSEIDRAVSIFDEVGIDFGVNLSGMWPGGPLEAQLAAAERTGRLVVACNLPWIAARTRPDFPERAAELLQEAKRLGARALKIEKALGMRVRNPDGALVAVDDPWLDPIWQAAGALHMPVVIHTADPKAFWLPVDEHNERFRELEAHPDWSNAKRPDVPTFEALLIALERVVAKHPATTFVSVHFGNNAEDPFAVARLLDTHPNLYVDLAARIPELGRHDPEKLRDVFLRHADRILFGSDLGVSEGEFLMLGSFGKEPNRREEVRPFFDAHWAWLETARNLPSPTPIQGEWTIHGLSLPDEVLEKIYRGNALRLFGPAPKKPDTTESVH